jgi:N utilization substance protein A
MMVAFGENGIKTVEDLADCATDELTGWTERKKEKDGENIRHKGILDGFDIGKAEAEALIIAARIHAGWIKAEDFEQPAGDEEMEAEAADGDAAAAKA